MHPALAVGLAVPAVIVKGLFAARAARADEPVSRERQDDLGTDPSFTCERVCTSPQLLRRMGGLAKVWPRLLLQLNMILSVFHFDLPSVVAPVYCRTQLPIHV